MAEFKANPKGIAECLRLPGVLSDLERRAARIRAAAPTANAEGEALTYETRSEMGRRRARAAVIAAGGRTNAHELAHHELIRLIDHAR